MAKQNLTPTAKRMKAARDKKAAMTDDRRKKKAENQRKRRAAKKAGKNIRGKDYDHKDKKFKSVKANRGNDGNGTKKEQGSTLYQVINQKQTKMTYLYYKTSTYTSNNKPNEKTINQWKHLADKSNWRITQLPNGFYQTEVNDPESDKNWCDVTRRETIEGAEAAIDGSIDHFSKKLEATKGPKVVKTFE